MNKREMQKQIEELKKRVAELEPKAQRWGRVVISGNEKQVVNVSCIGKFSRNTNKYCRAIPVLEIHD